MPQLSAAQPSRDDLRDYRPDLASMNTQTLFKNFGHFSCDCASLGEHRCCGLSDVSEGAQSCTTASEAALKSTMRILSHHANELVTVVRLLTVVRCIKDA